MKYPGLNVLSVVAIPDSGTCLRPYVNEYLLKPYSLRLYSKVNYGDKQAQRGLDQSHFIIRVGLFPY